MPEKKKGGAGKTAGTEPEGGPKLVDWGERKITIFHNFRLLPRVSVVFPTRVDGPEERDVSALSDEELLKLMLSEEGELPSAVDESTGAAESPDGSGGSLSPEDAVGRTKDETAEIEPLEVAKRIVNADGKRDVVLPGGVVPAEESPPPDFDGADVITEGSTVLVEGKKGMETRAVTENLCYGLLENGYTVTYVTTALTVKDFIVEMHSHNYRIAKYLPDRQLLCIPVYPILEGIGGTEGLLDKLMSSPQLQTTDAIIVDNLSDFLGGDFDEVICMRLLEYLRHLSGMGKTVFLVVDDGQKGILSLRLASDLHFALPTDREKPVQAKRYQSPRAGSKGILYFRIDPAAGLISKPREEERRTSDQ